MYTNKKKLNDNEGQHLPASPTKRLTPVNPKGLFYNIHIKYTILLFYPLNVARFRVHVSYKKEWTDKDLKASIYVNVIVHKWSGHSPYTVTSKSIYGHLIAHIWTCQTIYGEVIALTWSCHSSMLSNKWISRLDQYQRSNESGPCVWWVCRLGGGLGLGLGFGLVGFSALSWTAETLQRVVCSVVFLGWEQEKRGRVMIHLQRSLSLL